MHLLHSRFPFGEVAFPALDLAGHLRLDHRNHAVQHGVHVVAGEMGIAQVGPPVDVGRPEVVVVHQGVEHRDVPLSTHVTHVLRVARICLRTGVRQARVVGPVPEGVVHVPQGIAPAASVSIRIASAPPGRVPVQPVGTDHVAVEDEVVDERHLVQLADRLLVVGIDRHVVARDEVNEIIPIVPIAILFPGSAPRLQEVDVIAALVVVAVGEVAVVDLLPVLVDTPVLAVDVKDAALARPLVEVKVCQRTQGLHVGIANVGAARVGVVVVGRRLEDQTLELAAVGDVEQLCIDHIIMAHLVPGDVVESLLRVGVGVIAVLIGIALGLDPERAVLVEELDVHRLVAKPRAVLKTRAADAHHTDRVAVRSEEVGVRLDEAGSQHAAGVDHDSAHHGGLHQTDWRNVGKARVGRSVPVKGIVNLHPGRAREIERQCVGMITRRLSHDGLGRIAVIERTDCTGIGRIGCGVGADLPISGPVHIAGPAVVLLVGADIRSVGVALYNGSGGVGQHNRFLLALVDAEVGVQEASSVQVARQGFAAAHDDEEAVGRHHRARGNLKFGGIIHPVGEVPPAQIHRACSLIVELHEILVVPRDVERVVRTGEFIDDDLRTQTRQTEAHQGPEEEKVSVQIQGSAMYGE